MLILQLWVQLRYARSLKPRNLAAVHFVIDDRRAESIQAAWAASDALDDVCSWNPSIASIVDFVNSASRSTQLG
jgi:hypothetical protein